MRHARQDYQDRIQDSKRVIPEDEPVFLLRAQDIVAPDIVDAWADAADAEGALPNIVEAARNQAQEMRSWQSLHGRQVPDMPEGA